MIIREVDGVPLEFFRVDGGQICVLFGEYQFAVDELIQALSDGLSEVE